MNNKKRNWTIIIFSLAILIIIYVALQNDNNVDGVVLEDPFIGPENASIVVVEYSDFECPYCGAAAGENQALMAQLKTQNPGWIAPVPELKKLAKDGEIKYVYKHFPLGFHKYAYIAAEASEAAHAQGKFWEYHDALFAYNGEFDEDTLYEIAEFIELDMQQFEADLDSGKYKASVEADMSEGRSAGISGTPSYLIDGQLIVGARSFEDFRPFLE